MYIVLAPFLLLLCGRFIASVHFPWKLSVLERDRSSGPDSHNHSTKLLLPLCKPKLINVLMAANLLYKAQIHTFHNCRIYCIVPIIVHSTVMVPNCCTRFHLRADDICIYLYVYHRLLNIYIYHLYISFSNKSFLHSSLSRARVQLRIIPSFLVSPLTSPGHLDFGLPTFLFPLIFVCRILLDISTYV